MDAVLGNTEEPPENTLSRPAIDGDIVENVVPLAPRDDTERLLLW